MCLEQLNYLQFVKFLEQNYFLDCLIILQNFKISDFFYSAPTTYYWLYKILPKLVGNLPKYFKFLRNMGPTKTAIVSLLLDFMLYDVPGIYLNFLLNKITKFFF